MKDHVFVLRYVKKGENEVVDGPVFSTLLQALEHVELVEGEPWLEVTPWVVQRYSNGTEIMHTIKELDGLLKLTDREVFENIINCKSMEPYKSICLCGRHYITAEASPYDRSMFCSDTQEFAKGYDFSTGEKEDLVNCSVIVCECGRPLDVYISTNDAENVNLTQDDIQP